MKNYTDHKFVKKIIQDISYFHQNPGSEPSKLTYVRNVFNSLNRIKSILETLKISRVLLAETYHEDFSLSGSSLSKHKVILYHIENYFLRITTYKDLIIHLIAAVNTWSISDSTASLNQLKKKAKAENVTYVDTILSSVEIMFKKVKPLRNKIAHQGSATEIDYALIDIYEDLKVFTKEYADKIDMSKIAPLDDDYFEVVTNVTISKNISEMRVIEKEMGTNFFGILDILYPIYNDYSQK